MNVLTALGSSSAGHLWMDVLVLSIQALYGFLSRKAAAGKHHSFDLYNKHNNVM